MSPGLQRRPYADGKAGGAAFGGYRPTGIHNRIGKAQCIEQKSEKIQRRCP